MMLTSQRVLSFLLLPGLVRASAIVTYNDDVSCGAPFEDFKLESITCYPQSPYFSVRQNGNKDEGCSFGDLMELEGSVTLSSQVYSSFDVKIELCVQPQARENEVDTPWWQWNKSRTNCKSYKTKLNFNPNSVDGNNWLSQGNHDWTASAKLPNKGLSFSSDYTMTASLLFSPKKTYNKYTGTTSSAPRNWQCSGTFNVTVPDEVSQYYATAGIAFLVIGGAISVAMKRRRRISAIDLSPMQDQSERALDANFASLA